MFKYNEILIYSWTNQLCQIKQQQLHFFIQDSQSTQNINNSEEIKALFIQQINQINHVHIELHFYSKIYVNINSLIVTTMK